MKILSRNIPVLSDQTAFLLIDLQNLSCSRQSSDHKDLRPQEFSTEYNYYFDKLEQTVLPNVSKIQQACRNKKIEVIFTVVENLTLDGRERSLDYKITGYNVPKGSFDAKIPDLISSQNDEMIIPKSSSSVFISTNIDYILRNLNVKSLIIAGVLTDQCVESAVRDACDLGYLVTLVTDACTTFSSDRHTNSIKAIRGYCRQITSDELIKEIMSLQ